MSGSVLVTLDGTVWEPGQPLMFADDLAAVRGDGVFETLLVRDGRACLIEPHLRRLAGSAALLDLPDPDPAAAAGHRHRAAQWATQTVDEGAPRLVYSRGRESGSEPTAYLMISPLATRVEAARRDGVSAGAARPWASRPAARRRCPGCWPARKLCRMP